MNICYLDLDGVIANFAKRVVVDMWGEKLPENSYIDSFQIDKVYGKTKREFYKSCDGFDFWHGIEKYPWADDLVEIVDESMKGNWKFLTSPMRNDGCFSGKAAWVRRYFPKHFSKLIICGLGGDHNNEVSRLRKAVLCRSENDYLIDDSPKNIAPWRSAGGSYYYWEEVTSDFDLEVIDRRLEHISMDLQGIFFKENGFEKYVTV